MIVGLSHPKASPATTSNPCHRGGAPISDSVHGSKTRGPDDWDGRISIALTAVAARWNSHDYGRFGPDDAALSVIGPTRFRAIASTLALGLRLEVAVESAGRIDRRRGLCGACASSRRPRTDAHCRTAPRPGATRPWPPTLRGDGSSG